MKINKKIIEYNVKLLLRQPIAVVLLCFGYSLLIGLLINKYIQLAFVIHAESYFFKIHTMQYSYMHFIIIGIVSIILFSVEKDAHIYEALYNYTDVQKKNKVLIMLAINSIVFLSVIAIVLITYCTSKSLNLIRIEYIYSIIYQNFVDYFLIGIFSILCSALISQIKEWVYKGLCFAIVHFIFGYPFYMICQTLGLSFYNNRFINFFMNITALLPDGFSFGTDGYGVYPTQPHRVILILAWCFLIVFILLILEKKWRKQRCLFCGTGIILIILIGFSFVPYCQISEGYRTVNRFNKMHYEMNGGIVGREQEIAEFCVEEYNIKISAYLNMYAEVTAKIDNVNLNEYVFTLYDEYQIVDIRNQTGVSLEYVVDEHYITIFSGDEPISEIKFIYYGAGDPFYCDASGIFLQSGIPFFPFAGKEPLYDDSDYYNAIYYNNVHLPETTLFNVKINTIGEVVSSLPKVGHNEFSGYGDGFFILKGAYEIIEYEGATFIYPYATEMEALILDEKIITSYLEGLKECVGDEVYNTLPTNCILIDWQYSRSRMINLYSNHIIIPSVYFNESVKEGMEIYIESEGL